MFASAVGIEAHLETDVRAVILGDDAPRFVGQILRRRPAQTVEIVLIELDLLQLELVVR